MLRGALPQLAGLGGGFFESPEPAVRTLGELVARYVMEEVQLVEPQALLERDIDILYYIAYIGYDL